MDIVIFFVSFLILVLWFGGMNDLIENRRKTLKARKRWEEKEGDN
jgi:hypothetical protein